MASQSKSQHIAPKCGQQQRRGSGIHSAHKQPPETFLPARIFSDRNPPQRSTKQTARDLYTSHARPEIAQRLLTRRDVGCINANPCMHHMVPVTLEPDTRKGTANIPKHQQRPVAFGVQLWSEHIVPRKDQETPGLPGAPGP
uniref:Uncharacterized protein n=1 Tax=Eutreptiella gymnastica TaxID=73025 RepID=A0A7S4CUI0_9EUGL|mmetsp:Transcript_107176/g.181043  ORF Transcript_107176/g.181043 Transcript_107176/m.181043 type:complete len:142 (-) Transcript_107176:690-1115(-)